MSTETGLDEIAKARAILVRHPPIFRSDGYDRSVAQSPWESADPKILTARPRYVGLRRDLLVGGSWRGEAEVPVKVFGGNAAVRPASLALDDEGATISAMGNVHVIRQAEVAKVYVCKHFFKTYGLCFQMRDARDYVFWIAGRRQKAEDALWAVKRAGFPISRTIYRAYEGRLNRADRVIGGPQSS